ncbi:MAG TPA: right-handed parallel beta-helix repeat-containing protein [Spirochaetota bacterium]|nr:right-handed parallel beta-helix repeat-containing protein [Spirochaetota bacterium]
MKNALYLILSILIFSHLHCKKESATIDPSALLILFSGPAQTYYVDAAGGNDANDGLTSGTAWQSLDRVNSSRYGPGSQVLFRRDQSWRGQLLPKSRVSYGAYGIGEKPVIMGSVSKSNSTDWIDEGDSIWRCAETSPYDAGNMIFNGAAVFGFKKWTAGDCASQGDYYYDRATGELRIYSASNPADFYTDIEIALRRHVVDYTNVSSATFENLSVRYGAAHGFGGYNTAHITIRGCDISYIGGGDLTMDGQNIRFGNGIEFWGRAHDHLVEGNRIWEIYDSALTNQNSSSFVRQYNITYRNNIMWNCAMSSFEYWNRPASSSTDSIVFEHNTALYAGQGWGAPPQRPDLQGAHVLLPWNPARTSGIIIRNNIFYEGNLGLWMGYASEYDGVLSMDYNCWYQAADVIMRISDISAEYTMAQFADYQALTGLDAHSLAEDPQFVDAASHDYRLQAPSPCIDAGTSSGVTLDFGGTPRPQGRGPDMGAYEQ